MHSLILWVALGLAGCSSGEERVVELTELMSKSLEVQRDNVANHAKDVLAIERAYSEMVAQIEASTKRIAAIYEKTIARDQALAEPGESATLAALKSYQALPIGTADESEVIAKSIMEGRIPVALPADALKMTLEKLGESQKDSEIDEYIQALSDFASAVKIPDELKDTLRTKATLGEANATLAAALTAAALAGAAFESEQASSAAATPTVPAPPGGGPVAAADAAEPEAYAALRRATLSSYGTAVLARAAVARSRLSTLWGNVRPIDLPNKNDVDNVQRLIAKVEALTHRKALGAELVAAVTQLLTESAKLLPKSAAG